MEEKFQKAVEENKKFFGTPVFEHDASIRMLADGEDLMSEARPLDTNHAVDAAVVEWLLSEIHLDPPVLPSLAEASAEDVIVAESVEVK